jgi:hypothetical protein
MAASGTFQGGALLQPMGLQPPRAVHDKQTGTMKKTILTSLLFIPALVIPALVIPAWAFAADLADADRPYEFVPGGVHYARSSGSVFRWTCSSAPQLTSRQCWQAVPGIEPESFAPISFIAASEHAAVPSHYSKDSHAVYFNDAKLDAVDPATFKVLNAEWAATPRGIIYAGVLRPEIDAASLEFLEHGWARDKQAAYYSGAAVAEANPASLRVLNSQYAIDNAHVFYRSSVVATAKEHPDVASFQALGASGYAKDARSVFHQGKKIADADSASFVLIDTESNDCYGRDLHRVYYCGKPVALGDAESFVVLDSFFAIDNERVYFGGAAVETADRGTFRHFKPEDAPPSEVRANAEDKRNWYEVVTSNLVVTPKDAHSRE